MKCDLSHDQILAIADSEVVPPLFREGHTLLILSHGAPTPFERLSGIRGLALSAALRSLNTQSRRTVQRRLLRAAAYATFGS
jgi:hypothetical protein